MFDFPSINNPFAFTKRASKWSLRVKELNWD